MQVMLIAFIDATSVTADAYDCLQRKLPAVALTGSPMASPDTRSSILRFCCRLAELPLEANWQGVAEAFRNV